MSGSGLPSFGMFLLSALSYASPILHLLLFPKEALFPVCHANLRPLDLAQLVNKTPELRMAKGAAGIFRNCRRISVEEDRNLVLRALFF